MSCTMCKNKGIINILFLRKRHGDNWALIPMFQTKNIPNEKTEWKIGEIV